MAEYRIPVAAPNYIGPQGKAWHCDLVTIREKFLNPHDCTITAWIVYAPWAHPLWHSYLVSLIHLRSAPGIPDPLIHLPGATHELMLHACDPNFPLDITEPVHFLTPANFVAQFIATSDAAAIGRVEGDVRDICAGKLNPDTDALRQWIARYGDNGLKPEFRLGSQPAGHA
jgi:hypothetical protein